MVYYFTSAVALGAPFRKVSFAVPTGNFGDVLAGYVAKRMGLPLSRLIVATNANDILARALASGRYEPRGVTPTQSPSMDIQLSSNFERLLFDALGRDPAAVRAAFASLDQSGGFDIPAPRLAAIRGGFDAMAVGEEEPARRSPAYIANPVMCSIPTRRPACAPRGRGSRSIRRPRWWPWRPRIPPSFPPPSSESLASHRAAAKAGADPRTRRNASRD